MPTLTQRLTVAVQRALTLSYSLRHDRNAYTHHGYNGRGMLRDEARHYARLLRYLRRRSQRAALAHALHVAMLLARVTLAGQRAAYMARANAPARPSLRRNSWLAM